MAVADIAADGAATTAADSATAAAADGAAAAAGKDSEDEQQRLAKSNLALELRVVQEHRFARLPKDRSITVVLCARRPKQPMDHGTADRSQSGCSVAIVCYRGHQKLSLLAVCGGTQRARPRIFPQKQSDHDRVDQMARLDASQTLFTYGQAAFPSSQTHPKGHYSPWPEPTSEQSAPLSSLTWDCRKAGSQTWVA